MNFFKISLVIIVAVNAIYAQVIPYNTIPASFYEKDDVKILVTDSGLGGLSIAAEIYENIKDAGIFRNVEVIFFNAQPHLKSGYNSMKSTEEKVIVFNNALVAMKEKFLPDIILIGCNTLSVIYEYTEFSKSADIPVIGIIDTGVDLIYEKINGDAGSNVILFATETTVGEAKHKTQLIAKGINPERIKLVPCSKLAGNIERDPESRLTDSLVNSYVNDALALLNSKNEKIFVSYNCTHYGYIDKKFQSVFKTKNIKVEKFLNPNPVMAGLVFNNNYKNRHSGSSVKIRVVSQAELTPGKIGSLFLLIEPVSPETAEVLFDYEHTPDFFEWKNVCDKKL